MGRLPRSAGFSPPTGAAFCLMNIFGGGLGAARPARGTARRRVGSRSARATCAARRVELQEIQYIRSLIERFALRNRLRRRRPATLPAGGLGVELNISGRWQKARDQT